MYLKPVMAFRAPGDQHPPPLILEFAARNGMSLFRAPDCQAIMELVNRSLPSCIVFGSPLDEEAIETCRALKRDAFSAVIPVIFLAEEDGRRALDAMEAGADELLTSNMSAEEKGIRLKVTLHRADRDVSVHPSTRLPGTAHIERDITARIRTGEQFAVCYADLDHFKEFNDRYGYNRGDSVIGLLARILRDVVKTYAPEGFLGHIGGDDFIFNVPVDTHDTCCQEVLAIFDELIPWQYTAEDREAGTFLAKDRRGNMHQIPLMSLSIGVVTNRNRVFSHPGRVSELATEMKTFAKTIPGSVYRVDRRSDDPIDPAEIDATALENPTALEKP